LRVAATARSELDTLPPDAQLIVQMVIADTAKSGPPPGPIISLHAENNSLFGENNSLLAPEKFPEAAPPLMPESHYFQRLAANYAGRVAKNSLFSGNFSAAALDVSMP
jgi:hypothetical protein